MFIRTSVREADKLSISNTRNLTLYFPVTRPRRNLDRTNTIHDALSKKKKCRTRKAIIANMQNTIHKFMRPLWRPLQRSLPGPRQRLRCTFHS